MAAKKKVKNDATRRLRAKLAEALKDSLELAGLTARLTDERIALRKQLAESEASRQAWVAKAVELELRAELAEENLKAVLVTIVTPRPSLTTAEQYRLMGAVPVNTQTMGEPGDGDPRRYSKETRL